MTNPPPPPPPQQKEEQLAPIKKKHRPAVKINPPLMPLIDVMFTLLMFFLVSSRVRVPEGVLPSNLPEVGSSGAGVSLKVQLIDGGLEAPAFYRVVGAQQRDCQTAEELYAYLESVKRTVGPDAPVTIAPQLGVRWDYVVNAYNQALRVQFKKVSFSMPG